MQIAAQFDPSVALSGNITIPQSSANGKMVIFNESNISLQFNFQDGSTKYVPAWTAILLCGSFGGSNINWAHLAILDSSNPPVSLVIIETFAAHEVAPGTYPAALVRQTNVGNNIPIGTSVSSVANDGNPANTTFIEATVAGDAQSAVKVTNDAQVVLGSTANQADVAINGQLTLNNGLAFSGVASFGQGGNNNNAFSANGVNTHINAATGAILFDIANANEAAFNSGGLAFAGTANIGQGGNASNAFSANNTNTHINASGSVSLDVGTTPTAVINSNGINILQGKLQLVTGSFARVSRFTGTLGTASGGNSIAHNLGTTPDFVVMNVNSNTATTTYSCTADATNVHAFGFAALSIIGYAFHA